jgi:hypothetical protein
MWPQGLSLQLGLALPVGPYFSNWTLSLQWAIGLQLCHVPVSFEEGRMGWSSALASKQHLIAENVVH